MKSRKKAGQDFAFPRQIDDHGRTGQARVPQYGLRFGIRELLDERWGVPYSPSGHRTL